MSFDKYVSVFLQLLERLCQNFVSFSFSMPLPFFKWDRTRWEGNSKKKLWNRVFCCHFFWWLRVFSSNSLSNLSPTVCESWAYGKGQRCCLCMVGKIIHSWLAELCLHKKALVFLVVNVLEKVSVTVSSKRTLLSWGSLLKNVRCLSNTCSPHIHHYLVINFSTNCCWIFSKKLNLTTILIKEKGIENCGEQTSWSAFCWEKCHTSN